VANVSTDINAEISSDGSGGGSKRVGLSQHGSALFDGIFSFPDHGNNGSASHILDQTWEKGFFAEIGVVLFEVFLGGLNEFQGD
jgi:hypothetical protein